MPEDREIELQVSLKGMLPDNAFEIRLPSRFSGLSLGDLLKEVFPDSVEAQEDMLGLLDTQANPSSRMSNLTQHW